MTTDIKLRFPFSRFEVRKKSMLPSYHPGDHVLTFNWVSPKVGDVIVFENGGKKYLKRIEKTAGDLIYVAGDNKQSLRPSGLKQSLRPSGLKQSLRPSGLKKESAGIAQVKKTAVIGKVILRY